jgi:Zn ribbon nucleic-acid-binding protein
MTLSGSTGPACEDCNDSGAVCPMCNDIDTVNRRRREAARRREDVADLRERVAASGIQMRSLTDGVLFARVLDHVHDVDLAAEAILMEPRPTWLRTLIGYDLMKVYPAGGAR